MLAEAPAQTCAVAGAARERVASRRATRRIARLWRGRAGSGKAFLMHGDRVLFIDGEALVIDKPAGLPVDKPRDGSLSLENHLDSLKFGFQRWPTAVLPGRLALSE
jgi:23S rRNA-/tRNA-specific pseudouridylate synthase